MFIITTNPLEFAVRISSGVSRQYHHLPLTPAFPLGRIERFIASALTNRGLPVAPDVAERSPLPEGEGLGEGE